MKSPFLSQLKKRKLAILIAIFIFYILFISYSEAYSLIGYLSNVKIDLLIPVLLSVSLSLLIRSVRQLYLLKIINIKLHFKENALLYLAGLSTASYVPSRFQGVGIRRDIRNCLIAHPLRIYKDKFNPALNPIQTWHSCNMERLVETQHHKVDKADVLVDLSLISS
jgi:hypothetical protein